GGRTGTTGVTHEGLRPRDTREHRPSRRFHHPRTRRPEEPARDRRLAPGPLMAARVVARLPEP
ncbi:hypothetical protein ACFWJ4_27005, partial [Kitasatospora sp. NPDC127067]|uniref:hypothetical protein n=1 Tax=Kitasatospora sp. NPDC127067 TaxID=3347126 RepID=UPI003669ECCF